MRQIIVFLFLFCLTLYPQNYSAEWVDQFLNYNEKEYTDYYNETKELDLSELWMNEQHQEHFIGFIGEGYQRIYLHIDLVVKNKSNNISYFVKGQTKVKNNRTAFMGSINILHSKVFSKQENPTKRGFLIASYEFFEIPSETHRGSFTGVTTMKWYINNKNEVCYDDTDKEEDIYYSNCEFVGTWKQYNSDNELICNWGQYRIPYAMELDVGVESFLPADEFINRGWNDFVTATDGETPDVKWWH